MSTRSMEEVLAELRRSGEAFLALQKEAAMHPDIPLRIAKLKEEEAAILEEINELNADLDQKKIDLGKIVDELKRYKSWGVSVVVSEVAGVADTAAGRVADAEKERQRLEFLIIPRTGPEFQTFTGVKGGAAAAYLATLQKRGKVKRTEDKKWVAV